MKTMRPINTERLERWVGPGRLANLRRSMQGWYHEPINVRDIPGSVWVDKDGDFYGKFNHGFFASAYDHLEEHLRRMWRASARPLYGYAGAGFASIGDALARASAGDIQFLGGGNVNKAGPTGVVSVTSSLWRVGTNPAAGAAGSAAPGGRACTNSTTGAMAYTNPSSGTNHLTGASMSASIVNNQAMLYDRLFDVAKTMNSSATEAVTGVPTRYQNTTAGTPDYIGGNFLFVEVGGTALAATAHNWTTCTYLDHANAASTLPSLTGNSGAIVDRLDHPTFSWFAPLEAGDQGIKALTQMQCSAAVATGAINFVIGHPIAWMLFNIAGPMLPFSWLSDPGGEQAPRILDNACLALLEINKPATTATTYSGRIAVTRALP